MFPFQAKEARIIRFTIFWKGKKVYLDHKNKKLKKSKNQNFSKGYSPWVLSKNLKFFHLFISGKIRQENTSHDILERKNAFLDYKNKTLIKSKNTHFSKGVCPWCWSKNLKIFHLSFLGKTGQNNTFHDILEMKNVYFDNKNQQLKKSKNQNFFLIVHGFCPKI